MTVIVEAATHDDIPEIIASADALVATDSGRYDAAATDLGWAARTGLAYCTELLDSDDNLVVGNEGWSGRYGNRVTKPPTVRSGPGDRSASTG